MGQTGRPLHATLGARALERSQPISRKASPARALHLSWRLQATSSPAPEGARWPRLSVTLPGLALGWPTEPLVRTLPTAAAAWSPQAHAASPPDSLLGHQPAPRKGCPSLHPGLGHGDAGRGPTPEHSQPPKPGDTTPYTTSPTGTRGTLPLGTTSLFLPPWNGGPEWGPLTSLRPPQPCSSDTARPRPPRAGAEGPSPAGSRASAG